MLLEDDGEAAAPQRHGAGEELKDVRLQGELQAALTKISSIEKEAELAKQAAGTELVLMRRQLTSCQAALAEAEQVPAFTQKSWLPVKWASCHFSARSQV